MEIYNSLLRRLYEDNWDRLIEGLSILASTMDKASFKLISKPLLINCFPEYSNAKIKILIIGQQTYGWGSCKENDLSHDKNANINELIKSYEEFHLGRKYRSTPFWNSCNYIYKKLNPDCPEYGYLWTNIVKTDKDGYRPEKYVEDIIFNHFNVVPGEINILKPDVVIFFTGPNYRERLKKTFPNLTFEPVEGPAGTMLSSVKHQWLPEHTYETYHPKYLNFSGKLYDVLNDVIDGASAC